MQTDGVLERLAAYAAEPPPFPQAAHDGGRLCLLDALGCAALALRHPACTRLLGPFVPGQDDDVPGGARVPGTALALDPIQAAFNTSMLIRWLDYNDTWLAAEWGHPSDNIGALLRGVPRDGVERGQVLCRPGSVTPHTRFEAEVYILNKEEGGRHTPFFGNYRPQFYFRTTDVTGTVQLPEGTEMVMPGDNLKFLVELISPIAMEEKLRFAIREGGKTVGAGVVSRIIE